MALSIDALEPNLSGIGRYCLELVNRLPTKLGPDRLHCFTGPHWIDDPYQLLNESWKPKRLHPWLRRSDNWLRRRRLRSAVVHAPNYFLPDWAERGVASIHDLSVFFYPHAHPTERVRAFETQFEATLRRARLLVTDTETVRQELIAMFAVPPEKVVAVSLGAQLRCAPADMTGLHMLGLRPQQYILCVSTFEPRKRIDRLVRAHLSLPIDIRRHFPLVLAGPSGWQNENLNALIEKSLADGSVKVLGFVPDTLLQQLYAGASAFIYPSQYEGFGLPIVEAMAHGTPCIIADTPCLIEVAKGAARIVDPEDEIAFGFTIRDVIEDVTWRQQAAQSGRTVAQSYSWDACADEMTNIYRTIAQA
ncbi:MAG: glycosyltransferase family 1 protein [Novosphingobium sp.]|nr:glycosyltransferase family 1 protein [Novosphingobium sp.]